MWHKSRNLDVLKRGSAALYKSPTPIEPTEPEKPIATDPGIRLRKLLDEARDDPVFFNKVILAGPDLWGKQIDICNLVASKPVTVVQSGNGVGKSWIAAMLCLWYLVTRPNSIVLTTAPTAVQLKNVLWGYIRDKYLNSRIEIGGRLLSSPIAKIDMGERWFMVGISTTKVEKLSGYHAQHVFVVVDEGSGVESEIYSALLSCNPEKTFVIGNPIRTDGTFYSLCQKAQDPATGWGFAKISTLDSPHIDLERSPLGLADQGFLNKAKAQYGLNGPWFISHILGEFPNSCEDVLIPREWLDRSVEEYAKRGIVRRGPTRLSLDYAEGVGRDHSVICVRDDDNLLEVVSNNTWTPEELAKRVAKLAAKYDIEPRFIAWDSTGSGSDFANRLRHVGLLGAKAYRGARSSTATSVAWNLRSASFWALRRRLDPDLFAADGNKQRVFAISPEHMTQLRPQLQLLTYEINSRGKVCLLAKEKLQAMLGGGSPDLADSLAIGFMWGS